MSRTDPQPASGFRDYLPSDAATRQAMMNSAAHTFTRWGFSLIDTPSMERLDVLTGGDPEFGKQLYRARITDDDEPLGMRFDLTVPLARYVAAHADKLTLPLARYHIGKVWRGEHTQAGRYREFVQCDADIIGGKPGISDAHVIATAYAVFADLDLAGSVRIRISNRKILNGLADFLQFPTERVPAMLRAIDKLDKHSWTDVAAELADKAELDPQQVDGIQEFLSLTADTPEGLLDQADAMLRFAEGSHPGIQELRELISNLDALKVPRQAWELDLKIARGLGYYTGTVFETTLAGAPQYGSVCSGGRYDDLISRFAPMELAGVGMSIGMDRLYAALDELGKLPAAATTATVGVLDFDPECHASVLNIATQLRGAGIATAQYLGHEDSLKAQLSWAVKSQFPYVIIMGKSELEKGVVQLKDMNARTQEEVSVADIATKLNKIN